MYAVVYVCTLQKFSLTRINGIDPLLDDLSSDPFYDFLVNALPIKTSLYSVQNSNLNTQLILQQEIRNEFKHFASPLINTTVSREPKAIKYVLMYCNRH